MKFIKILIFFLTIIFIQGCISNQYIFKGKTYSDRFKAENTQKEYIANWLSSVKPLPVSLSDKKLIIGVPNLEIFKAKGVKFTGNVDKTSENTKEMVTFIGNTQFNSIMFLANAIKKKNIYKTSEIIITGGGHIKPSKNKDVLYFYLKSNTVNQWYISDSKYGKQSMMLDTGIEDEKLQLKNWFDSISGFAIRE